MDSTAEILFEVRRSLDQALRILESGAALAAEEWMLLATLVGDADLALRGDRSDVQAERLLLDTTVAALRDRTAGFTDPEFLKSTRAARRRNPQLFRV